MGESPFGEEAVEALGDGPVAALARVEPVGAPEGAVLGPGGVREVQMDGAALARHRRHRMAPPAQPRLLPQLLLLAGAELRHWADGSGPAPLDARADDALAAALAATMGR
ncbi:hypothetical protein [Streptomyces exfoliatus]|uniref:hypothetical protein n=1 Tax=Streptomyces exfoliatus TaxID=1905 RepID=UPI003C2D96B3